MRSQLQRLSAQNRVAIERGSQGRIIVNRVARAIRRVTQPRARLAMEESKIYTDLRRRWPGGHGVIFVGDGLASMDRLATSFSGFTERMRTNDFA